jgi:hypothetical protein
MDIKTKVYPNPFDNSVTIGATFSDVLALTTSRELVSVICQKIADRFVEERYNEIVAKLDVQAIANLTIAQAASAVVEEIQRTSNLFARQSGRR